MWVGGETGPHSGPEEGNGQMPKERSRRVNCPLRKKRRKKRKKKKVGEETVERRTQIVRDWVTWTMRTADKRDGHERGSERTVSIGYTHHKKTGPGPTKQCDLEGCEVSLETQRPKLGPYSGEEGVECPISRRSVRLGEKAPRGTGVEFTKRGGRKGLLSVGMS